MISNITQLDSVISTIRESIVNKNVPLTTSDGFKNYPDAVRAINFQDYTDTALKPTIHGVNYYDYNGDLLYVYTPQEFLALSAHPSQPVHTGLVADGWNWDLTDAQDFIENTCDCLNIGGLYITDDGWTRFYIDIPEEMEHEYIEWRLSFRVSVKDGIQVDWGDGSAIERPSVSADANTNTSNHRYYHAGKYCIRVLPDDDCIYTIANTSAYVNWVGYAYMYWREHSAKLYKAEIGRNVAFSTKVFRYCPDLETVTLPRNINGTSLPSEFATDTVYNLKAIIVPPEVTTMGSSAFGSPMYSATCICLNSKLQSCAMGSSGYFKVDSVIFPETLASVGSQVLQNCQTLRRFHLPNDYSGTLPTYFAAYTYRLEECNIPDNPNFTTLPAQCFVSSGIKKLEIPENITTIGAQALYSCYTVVMIFRPTTPPAIQSNTFLSTTSQLKIYVPYSADHSILDAYKTATNWTQFASRIYELDENGNIPT